MLPKSNTLERYDVYPKIIPVGRTTRVTVRATDPSLLGGGFRIGIAGMGDGPNRMLLPDVAFESAPRMFSFEFTPPAEGEYHVRVINSLSGKTDVTLRLYALCDDMLALEPLIGDFHAHSNRSDGTDAPAFVAAHYRQNGFDFLSLTDHRRYAPSVEAEAALAGLDTSFRVYHGEEIHTPGNFVHIVNFASDNSVNAIALDKKEVDDWRDKTPAEGWEAAVAAEAGRIGALPADVEDFRLQIAASRISSRIVREGGGMSIFAHPHWYQNVRNVPDVLSRYFLENGVFDAFELIGGQSCSENQTQIALFYDVARNAAGIPVVGSSDQHGTLAVRYGPHHEPYSMFTEERTLVLARGNTRDDVIEAVKSNRSLAVEKYIGQGIHYYGGSYRMTLYAAFLFEEYFPIRDELYFTEGRLMHDYIAGDDVADILGATGRRNAAYMRKYIKR